MSDLPIHQVLPQVLAALAKPVAGEAHANLVLVAPPGAGKTTQIAPALLDQPWCSGQVLLLSPRRLAARAAADRIAAQLGQQPGGLVGYATRMDSRHSTASRLLVLTEGIFRRRILTDPELAGVSAVLFDEVHERSIDSDFGLALALETQGALRPDLRLVAMSATLDGARFASLLSAPVIESAGRSWPLELRYLPRRADERIENAMAAAIRRALSEQAEGHLLAFLPGLKELQRTADLLNGCAAEVHLLHGSLDPAAQRRALAPASGRKVILATSIAETSLTIDGVRVVVDSGLARRGRYDRAGGVTRLVTERASRAAVEQRAGRAARQGAGVAYRLWAQAATAGLAPFDPPEIAEADLSSLLLDSLIWGTADPAKLPWLDVPPPAAIADARAQLCAAGAIDSNGALTGHGRSLAAMPLPVRQASMLLRARAHGWQRAAAEVAVLLGERGLGGTAADLADRAGRWRRDEGARAQAARRMALQLARMVDAGEAPPTDAQAIAGSIALGFPERVARRRDASGTQWLSVGGRGFTLDAADPLTRHEWLAVAEVAGAAAGARIIAAAPLDFAEINALFSDQIRDVERCDFDLATGSVRAERGRWLGAIALSRGPAERPDPALLGATLLEAVRTHGMAVLPFSPATHRLLARARWAGVAALAEAALLAQAEEWLLPMLCDCRRLGEVREGDLHQALLARIDWPTRQRLESVAPEHFTSPAGSTHAIDYGAEVGPTVTLRVQALFGLSSHPMVGQPPVPLVLSLTSPAGRPIQTTTDLPGFWAGSWRDVQKDMRGRYPKHPWPDDPAVAAPTLRTKAADARAAAQRKASD